MPQIILEISQKFNLKLANKIIDGTQKFLVEKLPTKLTTFKSRVYRYESCSVGGDLTKQIIHMQIKVLKGREQDHLNSLVINLRNQIISILKDDIDINQYSLTIEIIELAPAYVN